VVYSGWVGAIKPYSRLGYPAANSDAAAHTVHWNCCLSTACRGRAFKIHGQIFIELWGAANLTQGVPVEVTFICFASIPQDCITYIT
jgi:hypothetical protein